MRQRPCRSCKGRDKRFTGRWRTNGMDFAWSDQQRELLDAVGRFASQQLNYNVIENDRDGVFNHDAWKKCGSFGIQGLPVPTEYGEIGRASCRERVEMAGVAVSIKKKTDD